jgi:hypothetical protein
LACRSLNEGGTVPLERYHRGLWADMLRGCEPAWTRYLAEAVPKKQQTARVNRAFFRLLLEQTKNQKREKTDNYKKQE